MKEEIKEILEGIEVVIKHDGTLEFNAKELKILLDYITNLQQENEQLRTDINTFSNTIIEVNKECNSLFNHLTKKDLDYKSRIDKAIEYIEERKKLNWYADGVFVYELLNILGGDE